jgi:hypothetical protein
MKTIESLTSNDRINIILAINSRIYDFRQGLKYVSLYETQAVMIQELTNLRHIKQCFDLK